MVMKTFYNYVSANIAHVYNWLMTLLNLYGHWNFPTAGVNRNTIQPKAS